MKSLTKTPCHAITLAQAFRVRLKKGLEEPPRGFTITTTTILIFIPFLLMFPFNPSSSSNELATLRVVLAIAILKERNEI